MSNRLFPLWLVIGLIAGYAAAGRPAVAQGRFISPSAFVSPGDELRLVLVDRAEFGSCTVAQTLGSWIKCGPSDPSAAPSVQRWFNLDHAIYVDKREK